MKQVPEVTYIGHATLLLEVDGVRILTDPLLRNQVTFLSRYAPPAEPAQYKNLDAVLKVDPRNAEAKELLSRIPVRH